MDDLLRLDASELCLKYKLKALSPVEVAQAIIEHHEKVEPLINAFRYFNEEEILTQAAKSEKRWQAGSPLSALDGVPISIKDTMLTKGISTLMGSKTVDPNQDWDTDAPAVARLKEDGVVLVGKTTCPEFGFKAVGNSPLTGITRNPWDTTKTTGGSSAGAAAAVAAGMGPIAMGDDGGGSVRAPASFCGIVGFKPTFGVAPYFPPPFGGTITHIGPLARSVSDIALIMNSITRPDIRDWYAAPYMNINYVEELEEPIGQLRVAVSYHFNNCQAEQVIVDKVKAAADVFRTLGADVKEYEPDIMFSYSDFHQLWETVFAYALQNLNPEQISTVDPQLRQFVESGLKRSAMFRVNCDYNRSVASSQMQQLFGNYDILLTPTLPITAFDVDQEWPEPADKWQYARWLAYTFPFNLTQQPALSLPVGFDENKLPIGLQLIGAKYNDSLVLRAAAAIEKSYGGYQTWPAIVR